MSIGFKLRNLQLYPSLKLKVLPFYSAVINFIDRIAKKFLIKLKEILLYLLILMLK